MKNTMTVSVLVFALLFTPLLWASASNYYESSDYNRNYNYNNNTVTTHYRCGGNHSSHPCRGQHFEFQHEYPHYQYAYPQYNYNQYYYQAYIPYQNYYPYLYNQYSYQPYYGGYYNGGAWIPYYTY